MSFFFSFSFVSPFFWTSSATLQLREQMRAFGLGDVPIIMAGGVWWLEEWED